MSVLLLEMRRFMMRLRSWWGKVWGLGLVMLLRWRGLRFVARSESQRAREVLGLGLESVETLCRARKE